MLERFDTLRGSFRESFDPSIIKILHEPYHLMLCRRALGKEPVADTLDVTTDKESSRNSIDHEISVQFGSPQKVVRSHSHLA
jgi:hypothetical protein